MNVYLMYPDRDFNLKQPLPLNEAALVQDLELNAILNAMADEDKFILEVVRVGLLSSLVSLETIRYRQAILQDCIQNPAIVRRLYDLALAAIEGEKQNYLLGFQRKRPSAILNRSIEVLTMFMGQLKKLRKIAEDQAVQFESQGFRSFFAMLVRELDDDYLEHIQDHLNTLKFPHGVYVSVELGKGNKGLNYTLRQSHEKPPNWFQRILALRPSPLTLIISDRDESGARALGELKDRGINLAANALAQSVDHILGYFNLLRVELAFYIGCINLRERLIGRGQPVCYPVPVEVSQRRHSFAGLYDTSLALTTQNKVVGNTVMADSKELVLITGANQGGKSTFLRSIGQAQLMMQCGMFVSAERFSANLCEKLFTHFKREEDAAMESGKLDEELSRMSDIIDHLQPDSMVLFNESFAATNEREGSEIARQITLALLKKRIKVFFVTHLFEFAQGIYDLNIQPVLFLRAERKPDGERTFKLIEGAPLQTSFGKDVYQRIFESPRKKFGGMA